MQPVEMRKLPRHPTMRTNTQPIPAGPDGNLAPFRPATLLRRQFLQQAAVTGGALAVMPGALLGRDVAAATGTGVEQVDLTRGWSLKAVPSLATLDASILAEAGRASAAAGWLETPTMPAAVHDILLHHRKIEEPWRPGGTEKCFWVLQQDWVYAVRFPAPLRSGREYWLHFHGLKSRADVYLNGERIATHPDAEVPLRVDVSGRLQADNSLVVHCHAGRLPGRAGEVEDGRRKPAGSYLGPNPAVASLGIYGDVWLELSDGHRLQEVVTGVAVNEALTEGTVTVDAVGISRAATIALRVRLLDPAGKEVATSTTTAGVTGGEFQARGVLQVKEPRLWWPRGYGQQPLYRAEITLLVDNQPQQTERRTIGFRRLTMPENLHFFVNGVRVFIRGGDWVTPNLLSDVWDQARHERLFALAENAHFNAFRLWASVAAPSDAFYEMADARGFLLWQDFPRLPLGPDERSKELSCEKAARLIKRVKHHASVLSWCGGNEAAMWAHEDYRPDYKDHGPWTGLPAAEAVGELCRQLDPDRHYQPSSPYGGINANDPREGNTHGYSNMWFVPGYDYLNFASEDTRIACPPLHSLQRFMLPEDLWPAGYTTLALPGNKYPFPKTWLPYTTSESWKKTGPVEQFYDAADAASLVYRLGMAEALYYQDTVERQRRGRPADEAGERRQCGGYIVWKYNDSWTQVYSAKVDYFLEPYHAYYALRRAYAPVLLSFDLDTFIHLWVANDTRETVQGTVKIQLYHLEKTEFRKEIVRDVSVPPGKSVVVVRLDQAGIRAFRREHLLFATLTDGAGRVVARANAFADIERRLAFPAAKLDVRVERDALVITTDTFARAIHLEGDAQDDAFGWFFEDNYFDLLPGERKVIRILGQHAQGRVKARAWYSPHATAVDWRRTSPAPQP